MRRTGFVVHAGRSLALFTARELVEAVRHRGFTSRVLEQRGGSGSAVEAIPADEHADPEHFPGGLDLVVSVGGDGTFLRAAHQAQRAGCPVLGVNVGRLGFLTVVDPDEAADTIEQVLRGAADIEDRLALEAHIDGGGENATEWALNEIMVEKHSRHRVIRLAVYLGTEYVTTFSGDGVIVATPTGSTAYSFSARGPIVSPGVACLIVTPVAAHMVFDRSFVIGPDEDVGIEVRGDEPGLLSADGRESLELPVGTRVSVRASGRPARLVRPHSAESFYARVRNRFHLPDDEGGAAPAG